MNLTHQKRKDAICIGLFLTFFGATLAASAQNLSDDLFAQIDQRAASARAAQAHVLSPENYRKGIKAYREAVEEFQSQGELGDINEDIEEANDYFEQAMKNVEVAQATLPQTLNARQDALAAQAPGNQAERWKEAEETFQDAVRELENGDLDDAREEGKEAEAQYRRAELEAIKTTYLVSARRLIDQAEDQRADREAPQTFALAQKLLSQAEKELTENRYDFDAARQMAQQAEYEARHALYLSDQIESLEDNDTSWEAVLLAQETALAKVAAPSELSLAFDQGTTQPVDTLARYIAVYRDSVSYLNDALASTERRANNLDLLVAEYAAQQTEAAAQASARQQALENKLAWQADIEEKFDQAYDLFQPNQAQVFRQENDVIIRLYGLTFPVGKAEIKPEYFPLLTQVQQAIRTFDNAEILIEGHTDSQGGDALNQALSEKRAQAVQEYLKANMDVPPATLDATGFGESQPVANNETKEGRAKNRRIDVIIRPEFSKSRLSAQ